MSVDSEKAFEKMRGAITKASSNAWKRPDPSASLWTTAARRL